jgi:hypothetical protein
LSKFGRHNVVLLIWTQNIKAEEKGGERKRKASKGKCRRTHFLSEKEEREEKENEKKRLGKEREGLRKTK